jgi:hypothetical protein
MVVAVGELHVNYTLICRYFYVARVRENFAKAFSFRETTFSGEIREKKVFAATLIVCESCVNRV